MNTPNKLRQEFLEKASPLIDEYINASLGKSELRSTNSGAREEVWDALKQIILKASDVVKLHAESTKDVLSLLGDGKLSLNDAERLMKIMGTHQEATELTELLEKVDELATK
ncbi:hypothetical protein [Solemya elarraichensis gill symbiont]|uniref:Uncharacterized protein n=1 Tax=Solemya elarraichensis gill symbiont TaxID=1918949 RepID=A0A1T2KZI6_9GAMM|nr:hypothetical protein [Solemya elarraichensis gill symbiont]OOZ38180.1 hypothetical protein BOW52_09110 [Solemya elarraichensis gill symbiont]